VLHRILDLVRFCGYGCDFNTIGNKETAVKTKTEGTNKVACTNCFLVLSLCEEIRSSGLRQRSLL